MQFQVEKDRVSPAHQLLDNGRAGRDVELKADLEPLALVFELTGECQSGICGGYIERNNQTLLCLFKGRDMSRAVGRDIFSHRIFSRREAREVARDRLTRGGQ